jgi:hypothetical protein
MDKLHIPTVERYVGHSMIRASIGILRGLIREDVFEQPYLLEGEGCLVALLRGAGFRDLRGVMTVAEHLAGGGGVLWEKTRNAGP